MEKIEKMKKIHSSETRNYSTNTCLGDVFLRFWLNEWNQNVETNILHGPTFIKQ